jgi:hypothetical protein
MPFDMEVRLEPHRVTEVMDSPTGPVEVTTEFDQYFVFVCGDALRAKGLASGRMQVGWIGKQPGANFCPILAFYKFHYPQQQWIADEAKRLHGAASPLPHVEIPPPEPDEPEELEDE